MLQSGGTESLGESGRAKAWENTAGAKSRHRASKEHRSMP